MIVSFTLILLAQLVGEVAARSSGLPIPGPVIGMALMLCLLAARDTSRARVRRLLPEPLRDGTLETVCKALLAHLSLMFVPAGVGVVGKLDVLAAHGAALAVIVVVSVLATLTATVLTFVAVTRALGSAPQPGMKDEP